MFETISYEVAGRSFSGLLATPQRPGAGVLMFHGGGGVGEHERDRIRMLAALGYTAFAPDLFGDVFTDRARGMAVIGELLAQPAQQRARTNAALQYLMNHGVTRVAAIGHVSEGSPRSSSRGAALTSQSRSAFMVGSRRTSPQVAARSARAYSRALARTTRSVRATIGSRSRTR